LKGHQDAALAVAWSPDGKTLASAGKDSTVRTWGVGDGKLLRTIAGTCPVVGLTWSPDGKTLLGGGTEGWLRRWDASTGEVLQDVPPGLRLWSGWPVAPAWSPDGSKYVISASGTVTVWQADSCLPLLTLPEPGADSVWS